MNKELLLEAIAIIEKYRDNLLLKPENRIVTGEATEFIRRAYELLKTGSNE